MSDIFDVGSLSEEDLKEFTSPSLEDTIEKEEESTETKTEDNKEKFEDKNEPGTLSQDDLKEFETHQEGKEEEDTTSEESQKKEKTKSKKEEVSLDFQAVYQNYVDKGVWVPVTDEQGNEIEVTDEETFVKLMDWQVTNAAENALKEREAEFGEQYQSLVKHLKNGGSVEELAGSFQQEKDIESISTDDIDGAESIIRAYYESLDWDKTDIKEQIESLKDRGDASFKAFAEKRKGDLVKSIASEREEIMAERENEAKRIKAYQENYNKELKKAIYSQETTDRKKKELEKFYYDLKHPVNGGRASDFYMKFEEIRQDPKKWTKVVEFIKDFENFENKTTTEKEVKKNLFKLVREGESITKKDSQVPELKKTDKKEAPQTFKRFYNSV